MYPYVTRKFLVCIHLVKAKLSCFSNRYRRNMAVYCFSDPGPSLRMNTQAITDFNHNYNKIVKSDWLATALISALIGQK